MCETSDRAKDKSFFYNIPEQCSHVFKWYVFGPQRERGLGFTIIELLMVMVILGALASIATPLYYSQIEKARIVHAIAEIRIIEKEIAVFNAVEQELPETLATINRQNTKDPWGTPYQYLNFTLIKGVGKMRKDRFLVPLNSDYDLYSKGKDGESMSPLTAKPSHDDIIRANDGGFVGLASEY